MKTTKSIVSEPWVRITYTTPKSEMTIKQKADCERLEKAINQAMGPFHEGSIGLIAIELYPCDERCQECEAA
jgi:hypothetical protein